jgi:hypothetical protein
MAIVMVLCMYTLATVGIIMMFDAARTTLGVMLFAGGGLFVLMRSFAYARAGRRAPGNHPLEHLFDRDL